MRIVVAARHETFHLTGTEVGLLAALVALVALIVGVLAFWATWHTTNKAAETQKANNKSTLEEQRRASEESLNLQRQLHEESLNAQLHAAQAERLWHRRAENYPRILGRLNTVELSMHGAFRHPAQLPGFQREILALNEERSFIAAFAGSAARAAHWELHGALLAASTVFKNDSEEEATRREARDRIVKLTQRVAELLRIELGQSPADSAS
ncbi:MAG TPA: hypothetical protein VFU36_05415 [Jatrophihabitans sp.]|nr:hypothetical protein [Jatrophihabitans sp.]